MGPQINKQQIETSTRYVDIAQDEGAELLQRRQALDEGAHGKGYFFAPTIFGEVKREDAHRAGGSLRSRAER